MADKKAPIVFYSWQSDLPNNTNRGLIEAALTKACKELSADLELAIRVDDAVKGESGSPDIAATILAKIEKATVVVADVSIIGAAQITASRSRKKRHVPNANVMFELGYAKRALTAKRVIMVCNKGFGPIEKLPFDIRGRSVLGYSYKGGRGAKPSDARNELIGKLKGAIAAALEDANASEQVLDAKTEERVRTVQMEQFQSLRARLTQSVLTDAPVTLVPDGAVMVLHVVPAVSLDGAARIDLTKVPSSKVVTEMSPYAATGWAWFHDAESIAAAGVAPDGKTAAWAYTRLFETGALQVAVAVDTQLNSIAVTAAEMLARITPSVDKLGLQGRCFIAVDVLRAKGTTIVKDRPSFSFDNKGRPISDTSLSAPVQVAESLKPNDAAKILKPVLDWIWRKAGFERCWYYDDQGNLRAK